MCLLNFQQVGGRTMNLKLLGLRQILCVLPPTVVIFVGSLFLPDFQSVSV